MHFDPQSNCVPDEGAPALSAAASSSGHAAGKFLIGGVLTAAFALGGWGWLTFGGGPTQAIAALRPALPPVATPAAVDDERVDEVLAELQRSAPRERRSSVDSGRGRQAYEQGRKDMAMGRHADAVTHLSDAVRLDPKHADAHYKLGLAYLRTNDRARARDELVALENLDKSLASLLENLIQ